MPSSARGMIIHLIHRIESEIGLFTGLFSTTLTIFQYSRIGGRIRLWTHGKNCRYSFNVDMRETWGRYCRCLVHGTTENETTDTSSKDHEGRDAWYLFQWGRVSRRSTLHPRNTVDETLTPYPRTKGDKTLTPHPRTTRGPLSCT